MWIKLSLHVAHQLGQWLGKSRPGIGVRESDGSFFKHEIPAFIAGRLAQTLGPEWHHVIVSEVMKNT